MRNVSTSFEAALRDDKRHYREIVRITLTDGTVLNLTNADIWQGGFSWDDALSSDNDFQLGTAIVNKFSLTINNIYGTYTQYDFTDAEVYVKIGLEYENADPEDIEVGVYIVNTATYNGELIRLECLDFMVKFDRPYNDPDTGSQLEYPQRVDAIIRDACQICGVSLKDATISHGSFVVNTRPTGDDVTFREVLAWCCQIIGLSARMTVRNSVPYLALIWYSHTALANAMNHPTARYSNVHYISSIYSRDMSVDEVLITGVKIVIKTDQTDNPVVTKMRGTTGYVVSIENNPMITESNYSSLLQWWGTKLIGKTFRKASISHGSLPHMEAGDVAIIQDRNNNWYPILITRTNFTVGSPQQTISAAQTPARNLTAKYSVETRNYVEAHKAVEVEKSARELADENLRREFENGSGLYLTPQTVSGATTYYLHNKPDLADSAIRIRFNTAGISVTSNGTDENPTWYGLTADGDMLVNLLSTTGILFDWASGGVLTLGGRGNDNGILEIKDVNGNTIVTGNQTGLTMYRGVIRSADGSVIIDLNNNTITFPDGSISSNMLSIGDFTNYATVNPYIPGTMCTYGAGATQIITDGSSQVFRKVNASQNNIGLASVRTANTLQVGDELYFEITARVLSGQAAAAVAIACYDGTPTFITSKTSAITLTASYQTFTGTLSITNSRFNDAAFIWFYIRDDRDTKSQILVKSAKIWRKFGGNVVIDGSLSANKIHGDALTLGGSNNENGTIEVYNSSNILKGRWNNEGATFYGTYVPKSGGSSASQTSTISESGVVNVCGSKTSQLAGGYLILDSGSNNVYLEQDAKTLCFYNGTYLNNQTLEIYGPTGNSTYAGIKADGGLDIRASTLGNSVRINFKMGMSGGATIAYVHLDGMQVNGTFTATGTKSRLVNTDQYSDRLLYCYETASPTFGDIGEGIIGEDGKCYVSIDPIFAQTVNTYQYQVFLQKYGQGECYVSERHPSYFVVTGTEGLAFGWEIKAKQSDFDQLRLERNEEPVDTTNGINYATEAVNHIKELQEGRLSA